MKIRIVTPAQLIDEEPRLTVPLKKAWSESAREAALAARKAASEATKAGQNPKQAAAIAKKLVQEKGMDRAAAVARTSEIMSQQGEGSSPDSELVTWREGSTLSRSELDAAGLLDNPEPGQDLDAHAIEQMLFNFSDGGELTNDEGEEPPSARDPELHDRMESAFQEAGMRDNPDNPGGNGDGVANLHIYRNEDLGSGFGVSSLTGRVYLNGQRAGRLSNDSSKWAAELGKWRAQVDYDPDADTSSHRTEGTGEHFD